MDTATLTRYDLSRDENVSTLRTEFLSPALAAGDRVSADRILAYIVKKRPDRIEEQIELIDLALDADDLPRAQVLFGALTVDFTDPQGDARPRHCVSAIRIALRLKDVGLAVKIARRFAPDFADTPMLALLAMRAFDRAGETELFLQGTQAVARLCPDDPEKLAEVLHLLTTRGAAKHALELLQAIDPMASAHLPFLISYGRAMLKARATDPRTITILEAAHRLDPDDAQARLLLSKAYLRAGKPAKAMALFEDDIAASAEASESLRAHLAELLLANRRAAQASQFYSRLVEENPSHAGWKRALVSAKLASGETDFAKQIYAQDLRSRGLDHYSCFGAALSDLGNRLDSAAIPPERFEWAYRRLDHMGCAPTDRPAWENRCRWVHLADHLTLDWIEARSDEVDQIRACIQGGEAAIATLRHHAEQGLGVFVTNAHIGALFAGPLVLADSDLDYRWVASTPVIADVPGAAKLISTQSQNRLRLAKNIIGAIREGAVISVAVDGVSTLPIPFLDDQISVSDFTPRTIFQSGAKSFFPQVVWQGERITVKTLPLPDPKPTDTLDQFLTTWLSAYANALANTIRAYPDNMRLTGGFWGEVQL